jgi:hypothetical protein
MDGIAMEIRDYVGEKFPLYPYDKRTRDALTAYCARRWPGQGRRSNVAKEWDLNPDEARSVVEGKASWQTWDKIVFHKRGRWAVLFPVFGALLDQTAEQHIIELRRSHEQKAERLAALTGDIWPLRNRRRDDPPRVDRPEA